MHGRWMFTIATVLSVTATAVIPARLDGQLGGLRRLKDSAREAAGSLIGDGERSTPEAPSASASTPSASGSNIQITSDLLVRFEAGLRAEAADRAEVAKLLAPEVRERFRTCSEQAMMSSEAAELVQEFTPRFEGGDMQKALLEYEAAIQAMVAGKCGTGPGEPESLRRRPATVGREAAGMEERDYAMLRERTLPFCARPPEGTRIPGEGRNIYYVYTEAEADALRAHCPTLLPLLAPEG